MSGLQAEQAAWVARVLAITIPAANGADSQATPAPAQTAGWPAARQAWQDANDSVNDQINALRQKLHESAQEGDGDIEGLAEALNEIADGGLNAITEDHRVKLMASIMSIGAGSPADIQKFGPKALSEIAQFRAFLDGSPIIAACDTNPFDVKMSLRATLGAPLGRMEQALLAAGR